MHLSQLGWLTATSDCQNNEWSKFQEISLRKGQIYKRRDRQSDRQTNHDQFHAEVQPIGGLHVCQLTTKALLQCIDKLTSNQS